MGFVMLIIAFVLGAKYAQGHGVSHPQNESWVGNPDYSCCVLACSDVPWMQGETPGTEAAYHQDSVIYVPAFGSACNHGEELII